jgi:hypothetical protein
MTKYKIITRSGLFCLGLVLFFHCAKKEETRGVKAQEGSGQSTVTDLAGRLQELAACQERLLANPEELTLRQVFLAASVDSVQHKIYAAGFGKPPVQASNSAMASQAAERAAYIDGCRWLAYVKAWQQDVRTPFGSIQGQIPPSRVVQKEVEGEQVRLLVEAEW